MEPPSWGRRKAEKPLFRLMHFDGLAQSALDTLFFNERSLPAAARTENTRIEVASRRPRSVDVFRSATAYGISGNAIG